MTKVAVALSGGVDSSVAALLLIQQGYEVVGISAKTTNTPESEQIIKNAEKVANQLKIPFYPFDATQIFEEKVIKYFEDSYKLGETPNPCIMCNKYMKWGALFDYAINELDVDYIATGHYAKIKNIDGIFKFYPASDEHKDQLYFLFTLNQEQLKRTLFPLSEYKKEDIRKIAHEKNLPCKSSKESQDICFIKGTTTTKKYLTDKFEANKNGNFIEKRTGKILGKHNGYWQYTIGQRKGIGLAAPEALYVIGTDPNTNIVYVGYKDELLSEKLELKNINWSYPIQEKEFKALVKIRYNMKAVDADIIIKDNNALLTFTQPVSAIAKGQACVLYDINDGHLLGGAFI